MDRKGPYILEGGHRYSALKLLGAKSFPALVVVDGEVLDAVESVNKAGPPRPGLVPQSGDPERPVRWVRPEAPVMPGTTTEGVRIPPGWTGVWRSLDLTSPLQATGVDSKGRKQAIYSAAHSAAKAAEKFARMKEFDQVLPSLRATIQDNLGQTEAQILFLIGHLSKLAHEHRHHLLTCLCGLTTVFGCVRHQLSTKTDIPPELCRALSSRCISGCLKAWWFCCWCLMCCGVRCDE